MTYLEVKKMKEESYRFFDTIDFIEFMPRGSMIDVDDIIDSIEEHYDNKYPQLLPKEFQGHFFNVISREEFATYLKNRYAFRLNVELIEKYYLIAD